MVSSKFAFKAFLIQVANHKTANALPIQFVHYDKLSADERDQITQLVAMVKFKEIPVANPNTMIPSEVVKKMHKDYGYTQARVEVLIEKLNDSTEFDSLFIVAGRDGESAQSEGVTHA